MSINRLRTILSQEDTIIFVGSGVSLWSGLPSWSGMIEEMAKLLEELGRNSKIVRSNSNDLLLAATYGLEQLTRPEIAKFFRASCKFPDAKPAEIHRYIVSFGARCFVTTNYDTLIEDSLRLWRTDRAFRLVTNNYLIEIPELMQARVVDFIFKPHGDISDCNNIVLTNEDYKQFQNGGKRVHVLECLKHLLISRPVVYIGFGLRDPDFLHIRNVCENIFKVGFCDHYAICADVEDEVVMHWRKEHGIQLVGYKTHSSGGKTDHRELLSLLDSLSAPPTHPLATVSPATVPPATVPPATVPPATVPPAALSLKELQLLLLRHSRSLSRFAKVSPEIPLKILKSRKRDIFNNVWSPDIYDHKEIDNILSHGPHRFVLIGMPGAGKSYMMRKTVASIADTLLDGILNAPEATDTSAIVPIFIDLKVYNGNLLAMIESSLPTGLRISDIAKVGKIKVFLDSFNELPRDRLDGGEYEEDFSNTFEALKNASIIISSRNDDGLKEFQWPVYEIDYIEVNYIKEVLKNKIILTHGRFHSEIQRLLQKPFYFSLYLNGNIRFSAEPHLRDFFESILENLQIKADQREFSISVRAILSSIAYRAIDSGDEVQPLDIALKAIRRENGAGSNKNTSDLELFNWLISENIIIPYTGSRFAFFHQSVTEFLAALELARIYEKNPGILLQKLKLTRWDQSLFLTLSLLSENSAQIFLDTVTTFDLILAFRCCKYIEFDRNEIVSFLLEKLVFHEQSSDFEITLQYERALTEIPMGGCHENLLWKLFHKGGLIGGVAAQRLSEIRGAEIKSELIAALVEHCDDYNFLVNAIAPTLRQYLDLSDLPILKSKVESVRNSVNEKDGREGFVCSFNALLRDFTLSEIMVHFFSPEGHFEEIHSEILSNILRDRRNTEGLKIAADLLLSGYEGACSSIHFICSTKSDLTDNLSYSIFDKRHIDKIIDCVKKDSGQWGLLLCLGNICSIRTDLGAYVETISFRNMPLVEAIVRFVAVASPANEENMFNLLSILAGSGNEDLKNGVHLLRNIPLNWSGRERLFVKLLKFRDVALAKSIIESLMFPSQFEFSLGNLEIGSIAWWLDWIQESKDFWFRERISLLFSTNLSSEVKKQFVDEFNRLGTPYRSILARSFLLRRVDITTDDFVDDAIGFLLADLKSKRVGTFRGHLLSVTATERFVIDWLLPLISEEAQPLKDNLLQVLRSAGKRHGRRYI